MAELTSDDCWGAIRSLATEDSEADRIQPHVIGMLIASGFVELGHTGLPDLTAKGWTAYRISQSGDGRVEEIDSLPRRK